MDSLKNETPEISHAEAKKIYLDDGLQITDADSAYRTIEYYKQPITMISEELKTSIDKLNPKDMNYIAGSMLDDGSIVWTIEGEHKLAPENEGKQEVARLQIAKPNDDFTIITSSRDKQKAIELTKFILDQNKSVSEGMIICTEELSDYANKPIYVGPINGFKKSE